MGFFLNWNLKEWGSNEQKKSIKKRVQMSSIISSWIKEINFFFLLPLSKWEWNQMILQLPKRLRTSIFKESPTDIELWTKEKKNYYFHFKNIVWLVWNLFHFREGFISLSLKAYLCHFCSNISPLSVFPPPLPSFFLCLLFYFIIFSPSSSNNPFKIPPSSVASAAATSCI